MVHIYLLDQNCMHYCVTSRAQIVLWSLLVYFTLALYFYHRSCLLAHQNAITILSVGPHVTDFGRAQRSPKEFPHSSSLGTKSHDYWHKDTFGPTCLRAQTCEQQPNTGHWPSPPSSTDVKRDSWSVYRCWSTSSFFGPPTGPTAFFGLTVRAWST